jgi:hypothetical protein
MQKQTMDQKEVVGNTFAEIAKKFIGQNVAVICARYHYRGVLSEANNECLVIANAHSVEVSGPSNSNQPQAEDRIGSAVVIKNDAIEILYQPQWCFAPLNSN